MKLEKFQDKNREKKKKIITTLIVLVSFAIGFVVNRTFASFQENKDFNMMNGNFDYYGDTDIYFAFYSDNTALDDMPGKESTLTFDAEKTYCDNGAVVKWNYSEWAPLVTNLTKTKTRCTLYFTRRYNDGNLNGADPVLPEGLIPIIIADNGSVTVANETEKWYDYSSGVKQWANAVILKNKSLRPNAGEALAENDIESYFVWVPRYRYQIFNDGNFTTRTGFEQKEEPINIVFESKDTAASTGSTVGEWLTHPAFTAFDVNGMWVGKFETGRISGEENVNDSSQVQIKPNVSSWRNIQVANAFYTSYNYRRDMESHMMKNTEWGAAAYLSMSNYGRGVEDIRMNNNSNYITGYAAVKAPTCGYTGTNDTCNKYGTSADITKPYNTDIGVLASTTRNIYGIYDMSGGAWEYVMGVMLDSTNTRPVTGPNSSNNSNFNGLYSNATGEKTNGLDWPDPKYYDTYAYHTANDRFDRRILGDATGEMGPFGTATYGSQTRNISSWYADYAVFVSYTHPWFGRGTYYIHGTEAGVSAFDNYRGIASGDVGFRVVLMP